MSADRSVFADLRQRGPAGSTGRATVYYTLNPADGLHANRLRWVTQAQSPRSAPISAKGGFTADWFSHNVPVWEKVLAPLAGRPLNALEVGVFEGRSAVWLLEWVLTHPDSSLTWVDTFGGSAEHAGRDLSGLEGRFRANVARFGAKVTGHVGRSQDILRTMQGERFDLVYLDGSHAAADVLADAVLAWPLLKPGGLLGFDDYKWRDFPEPEKCPGVAIDGFLASMRGRYREIHHGYQVWVQKLG
jgi:predicted O-methyltransferase YrrM